MVLVYTIQDRHTARYTCCEITEALVMATRPKERMRLVKHELRLHIEGSNATQGEGK